MWRFSHGDDGTLQVRFPDGSGTTLPPQESAELANQHLHHLVEKAWPQEDEGTRIANPFAAVFHDLFRFMTPEGMQAYDEIPEMFKMQQVNPYIRGSIAVVAAMQAVPLLEQVAKPLWEGDLTLPAAMRLTDDCIEGGFEAAWAAMTQQA
ncbi:hypothetical protein [Caenispirillum bisanense]|uniref:Uncharacterized protein n=1 Tax=Caenispirillum bisanense TaxID=414052 RepID=A0A286H2J1_9PROT|nr:hypothetical protein [Caenispirillum bisanense]SOE01514.1 hypothetical protein SAMN05421508_11912 [Caenispirillum bisanense]